MGSHGKPPLPYAYKPLPSGAAAAADADGERTGWTRWRVCATVLTASAMVVVVVGATLLAGFRVDQAVDEEAAAGFPWSNEMLQWQRSGYHFQTAKNYMSDPNGLMYYNGWYHMFFQYNPVGTDWDDGMEWGHAVSRNLVTWRTLPIAMVADQWYDILGVLSGSMTVLPNGTVIMIYTGATNASAVEVQCIATPADPNDPFLRRWTKHPANPVIWSPPGIGTKDFRDPMTAWYDESDDTWRTLLGSKDDHDGHHDGIAMMYKTKDFLNYELIPGILHRVQRTGEWECIDFYPVGHRTSDNSSEMLHVLKASMDDERHDYYSLGTYDSAANTWTPIDPELDLGIGLRYDWGKFYASTSFYDPAKKRRVLMGYVGEVDSKRADVVKGWASIQSVPRTIALDEKTRTNLLLWPVEEIETLRLNATKLSDAFSMRVLVDHSIVQGFAMGGRTTMTSRVYPMEAYQEAKVYLFNNATGASVTAERIVVHEMDSAHNQLSNMDDHSYVQ
ncbi:unnamed protein product [Triticum turgidum subsp. durum]|uniref:Sucrose:fructan 6-fructosyltransferase n=1 Tax=Triticum turgidum subsp. durum TaxID=4567 RepID=A0A9R0YZJ3_TRITD|nr:unnamed protein product [Triticum turgidum subsp. durum]